MSVTAIPTDMTLLYTGNACVAAQIDANRWAVTERGQQVAALHLGPTLKWNATGPNGAHVGRGDTPQAALDDLAKQLRRRQREESARRRLSPGQLAARELRSRLHIGPKTRRWPRGGRDRHEDILEEIEATVTAHVDSPLRVLWGACLSYDKHIRCGRMAGLLTWYADQMTPWELCALLGEMADAGVTNTGEGERWFRQTLLPSLTVDDSGRRVVRQGGRR